MARRWLDTAARIATGDASLEARKATPACPYRDWGRNSRGPEKPPLPAIIT
jgi:hypothetical protein